MHQRFHLCHDERQRGTEFMGNVGEEAQFGLVQGFYVADVLLLVFQRFTQLDSRLVGTHQIPEQDSRHYQVDKIGKGSLVVGRQHVYGQVDLRTKALVFSVGLYNQVIGSGIQVGIGDVVQSTGTVPVVGEAFQLIDDVVFVGGYIV